MDCLSPKDLLAAWNGLLSEAEQKEQALHLAQCSRCRELEKTMRELVRLTTLSSPTAPLAEPGACPIETELLDYVAQRVTGAGRSRLEAHLAACHQCLWQVAAMARAELEVLPPVSQEWREAVRKAELLVDEPPQPRIMGWRLDPAWRFALASAAAVALLAAGLLWNAGENGSPTIPSQAEGPEAQPAPASPGAPRRAEEPIQLAQQEQPAPPGRPQEPKPQVRQAPGATQSSPQVLWPREGQQVEREELEIRWQTVPGANLYEVTILNRSGDVVWEGQAQSTRVGIPDEVKLRAGERYFVWVLAHVPGQVTVRSPSVAFEIRTSATR